MNNNTFLPCADGTRLGLGGAPLGNLFQAMSEEAAHRLVLAAWDDGCRSFDTAPHYGHGLSERRMGHVLHAQARPSYRLSSKVGRLLSPSASAPRSQHGYVETLPFVQHWDFSRGGIRRSVEDSLHRLGLTRLDAVYVHDIDEANHGAATPEVLRQVLEETLPELAQLKSEGLVTHAGLGVNDHRVVLDVLKNADLDALMLAGRYTLLDTSALDLLMPQLIKRKIALALGGVFNSGILASRISADRPMTFNYEPATQPWIEKAMRIQTICDAHGVLLRSAALQFALAHPATHIVMLGARNEAEWQDARASAKEAIPEDFWTQLQREACIPENAPTPIYIP